MRRSILISISLCALLIGAGCQTTDPNKGGFFGGIGGLTSGNYQKGVDEREKALEDEKDAQIGLTREAERADQRNEALKQEIAALQTELDTLSRDVDVLRQRIATAEADKAADQKQLDALKAELDSIDGEIENQQLTFDETEKRAKIAELQRRKTQLQEALTSLLK